MQIKSPIVPQQLRNIHLEQDEQKTAAAQAPVTRTTSDSVEAAKANFLEEQFQAAQQNDGTAGETNLNGEQQDLVSKFHPENEHLEDASFFLKDARSSNEDHKNSGLQLHFGQQIQQSADQAKLSENAEKLKNLIQDQNTVHDGSGKDFSDMAPGLHVNIRDQFNNASNKKHQDLSDLGIATSTTDRLRDLADATLTGPQGGGAVYGKGMIADEPSGGGVNPSDAETKAYIKKYEKEHPNDQNTPAPAKTDSTPPPDSSVKPPSIKDVIINFIEGVMTPRGFVPPPVPPDKATGQNMIDGAGAILNSKNRTPDSVVKQDNKSWFGIPDPENSQANVPEALKKLEEYFKQQMKNLKPAPGGEKAHTTGDDTTVGGTPGNLIAKQGNLGLLGNPGEAPQGHAGTYTSGSNPGLNGGNVDFGPDSDKIGYTGVTHQDDPGDVQFGPQTPVAGMRGSQSTDNTGSTFDLAALREAIGKLWKEDPTALTWFYESIKKPE